MGFPRQGYWSGLPFPSPGDLPDPEIKPMSPTLQEVSCIESKFFIAEPAGNPIHLYTYPQILLMASWGTAVLPLSLSGEEAEIPRSEMTFWKDWIQDLHWDLSDSPDQVLSMTLCTHFSPLHSLSEHLKALGPTGGDHCLPSRTDNFFSVTRCRPIDPRKAQRTWEQGSRQLVGFFFLSFLDLNKMEIYLSAKFTSLTH